MVRERFVGKGRLTGEGRNKQEDFLVFQICKRNWGKKGKHLAPVFGRAIKCLRQFSHSHCLKAVHVAGLKPFIKPRANFILLLKS